jgi:maleylpyruvate isomerase
MQDTPLRLHGYWRSSATWRVRLALHLKGIPFEIVPVHLVEGGGQQWSEAYRALNPTCEVPALEIDGTVLAQSVAILEYLEETRPEPALLPADPVQRAWCRQLVEGINASIQPLQNLRVLQRLEREHGLDAAGCRAWAGHFNTFGLQAFEALLRRSAGLYCVGDRITLADVLLVPQAYSARRFGVDLTTLPEVHRIVEALHAHPAVRAAHAHRQPDTPDEFREA